MSMKPWAGKMRMEEMSKDTSSFESLNRKDFRLRSPDLSASLAPNLHTVTTSQSRISEKSFLNSTSHIFEHLYHWHQRLSKFRSCKALICLSWALSEGLNFRFGNRCFFSLSIWHCGVFEWLPWFGPLFHLAPSLTASNLHSNLHSVTWLFPSISDGSW